MQEKSFDYKGHLVDVSIWNYTKTPIILFDYNNVLNVYSRETLCESANISTEHPYAIVSYLLGKGENYENLHKRALETGECIVAITARVKENRHDFETGLKTATVKKLHWNTPILAFDDKPHEWTSDPTKKTKLNLDNTKKDVYKIILK